MKINKFITSFLSACLLINSGIPVYANQVQSLSGVVYDDVSSNDNGFSKLFDLEQAGKSIDLMNANDSLSLVYDVTFGEKNDKTIQVQIEGHVVIDGSESPFYGSADNISIIDIDGIELLLGTIDGQIDINGKEMPVAINFEQMDGNTYINMGINKLGSEDGFSIISFGESVITKDFYNQYLFQEPSDNPSQLVNDWVQEDYDWVTAERPEQNGTIARTAIYVEQDLYDGTDEDGMIRVGVQIDKDTIEDELIARGIDDFYGINCTKISMDFVTPEELLVFGSHHPDEDDTSSDISKDIGTMIANIAYDFGWPTYGLSTLINLLNSAETGDGLNISYDNDAYQRRVTQYFPSYVRTDFMDWSTNRGNQYCFQLFIQDADDYEPSYVEIDSYVRIGYFDNDGSRPVHGSFYSEDMYVDVNLER